MTKPVRIQLSQKKGFNLQEYSKSINGLPAVKCDRSTKWGNPFKVVSMEYYYHIEYNGNIIKDLYIHFKQEAIEKSIELFENLIKENDYLCRCLELLKEFYEQLNNTELNHKLLNGEKVSISFRQLDEDNFIENFKSYEDLSKARMKVDRNIIEIKNKLTITSSIIKQKLKGKNLACWCKENEPCYCDILLKIANEEEKQL